MSLKPQKQMHDSNCCQTCVAMVTGMTQYETMIAFGHDHGSYIGEIEQVLMKFGFETKRLRGRRYPELGIIIVRPKEGMGHAIAVKEGKVYDPSFGDEFELRHFEVWLKDQELRVTGAIAITGRRF